MAIFKLHSAFICFGEKEVLKEISFSLKTGEILGIFGRNGCGKTTLLKMIFGTLQLGSINISINDQKINPLENISKERIAYLPQHSFLPKNIKVRDIIPIYFDQEKKQEAVFYDPLIAKLAAKKIGELSLGQVRYLEVLLVGNLNHSFLMLDEPFSMIDPLHKMEISKLLNKLKAEKGIIITDHYYEDVLRITTQNLIIKEGISIPIESKEDLKKLEYLGKNTS
ncbi:ABC-type multidrug transport system, ATPase component [Aequorivita sublithincola DSM 14238]|uniref:ABC-type multidrug transport system, ATPase component n=1 Tax=Aequorivita sublithincola (strain DSM 14238 / LMG 21431 / ACAM 643 / 9-3) TaxID=746697 RepID=I3YZR0_AEQSU|nr:ATP-binding cassette domain-containing protein [Aequorivita sublithincola]AFL82478.1 ABC-type multidrug transport system, ATPase component [Aequorivita sublithincola DSM 14238]